MLGPDTSERASTTFCWLPPESWPTGLSASGVAMPSASIISLRQPLLLGEGEAAQPAALGLQPENDVFAHT